MKRVPVSVLGATGVVGQRFVKRLADHPWFAVRHLAASPESEGKRYEEACVWRLPGEPYAGLAHMRLVACNPDSAPAPIVFGALGAREALAVEPLFAQAGSLVFSNASAFRMEADVPLLVPEINPEHLSLLERQRALRGWSGGIVTNPNCTTTLLALALAPLHQTFGIESVLAATLQAVSGAGLPGVASLDLLGNVLPFIKGEEAKIEQETPKILGTFANGRIEPARFPLSAHCHRVPVLDGHTCALSVRLARPASPEQASQALASWNPCPAGPALPSAPDPVIRIHVRADRPQPRLDAERDHGMSLHVGRMRRCPLLGLKFVALGHNAERGAAGGSILCAELAFARGMFA